MNIEYEKKDNIAVFTLDNPPVNALTPEIHKQLFSQLRDFLSDDTIKVGIFTAKGDRAFCAGDDIKTKRPLRTHAELVARHMRLRSEDDSMEYPGWEKEVMQLNLRRYKPIVAAVNGPVMGQGLIYLMNLTDIRIASDNAIFGLPEIAYGMGGAGGTTRLESNIAPVAARWLALTGEPFDAETALRYNMINEITSRENLLSRAFEVANLIARHPQLGIRTEMEAIVRSRDLTHEQVLHYIGNLYRLQRVAFDPAETPLTRKSSD